MHRFFIDRSAPAKENNSIALSADDSAHIARVLRLRVGDSLSLCDGESHEYPAVIEVLDSKKTIAQIIGKPIVLREPATKITLYQALPKAGKLEYIAQKCTEAGVSAFAPFYSERCISKPQNNKSNKTDRYAKIIYEAAKQSRRGIIPSFGNPLDFKQMLNNISSHSCVLLAWEGATTSLKTVLKTQNKAETQDLAIIIGPEGGFSDGEVDSFENAGALTVSLGARIFRTETAGLVAAANILFMLED